MYVIAALIVTYLQKLKIVLLKWSHELNSDLLGIMALSIYLLEL